MVNTQYQYQYLQEAKDNTQYQYQYCQDAKVNTQYQYQYRAQGQYLNTRYCWPLKCSLNQIKKLQIAITSIQLLALDSVEQSSCS